MCGERNVTDTITGDTEVSLSFTTEHSYDEGSISGNTITYKCLNCDAAKETELLTLNDDDGILTAEIAPTDKVIAQGIVYAKEDAATLDTLGRVRIAYSEIDANRQYRFDAKGLGGYTVRAYVTYVDGEGKLKNAYSDPIEL